MSQRSSRQSQRDSQRKRDAPVTFRDSNGDGSSRKSQRDSERKSEAPVSFRDIDGDGSPKNKSGSPIYASLDGPNIGRKSNVTESDADDK